MRALIPIIALTLACNGTSDPEPRTAAPRADAEDAEDAGADDADSRDPYQDAAPPDVEPKELRVDPAAEDERPLADDVAKGRQLFETGDLTGARAILDQVVLDRSTDPDAWYWRGRVSKQEDDRAAARADLTRAVELDGAFASARRHLAELLVLDNDCESALPHLTRLVELRPEDASAHVNRGHCLLDAGDASGALDEARKACALGHQRACRGVKHMELRKGIDQANQKILADREKEAPAEGEAQPPDEAKEPGVTPPDGGKTP